LLFFPAYLFCFLFIIQPALAGKTVSKNTYANDTSKVNKWIRDASDSMQNGQLRGAMNLADSALNCATNVRYRSGIGISLNLKGRVLYRTASFDSAILLSQKALILGKDLNDSALQSSACLNIGNAYYTKGNDIMASEYYFKGLAIEERLRVQPNLYGFLNNIGGIFVDQKNLTKGEEYYLKSKAVAEKTNNNKRLGTVYHNLGSVYIKMGKIKEAHACFEKSYALAKLVNDIYIMNLYPSSMAEVYKQLKQYNKAYYYAIKSFNILKAQGFKDQITTSLMTLADIQINRKQYDAAENYLKQALALSEEIKTKQVTKDIYQQLANLFDSKGDYQQAYQYYALFSEIKDTILNQENSRVITEMNTKYTTEKKEKEIELLKKNEDIQKLELAKRANELGRQQTLSLSISAGFLLLVVVASLTFSRYRLKKKANDQLTKAFHLIEEKNNVIQKSNQLITDSIQYAKRIQDAILPDETELKKQLSDSFFILYQPAQIVSGDFYWCSSQGDKTIFVVADCTGHGVPGAFMSMIGNTLLNEIVNEQNVTAPTEIASLLDKKIIHSLGQHQDSQKYDGMDISICCMDKTTKKITFTGARQSMYTYNGQLKKIKGDPYSIGGSQHQNTKLFSAYTISYEKGLTLYFLTDGYCDQSAELSGKRFSSRNFELLLTEIQQLNMQDQKEKLEKVFADWKGNAKQRDDVLVVGIKC
jgi:tetratricopeptide (TPR) repeat protein